MKSIKIKCKNCGAKLVIAPNEEVVICKFCDSTFMLEESTNKKNKTLLKNKNEEKQVKNEKKLEEEKQQKYKKQKLGEEKKLVISKKIYKILFLVLIFTLSIRMVTENKFTNLKNIFSNLQITSTDHNTIFYRSNPKSSPVIDFTESVFQKKVNQVSKSEFEKIKYIKLDKGLGTWLFFYSFEDYQKTDNFDSTIKKVEVPKNIIQVADFQCFTGVKYLDFNEELDIEHEDSIYCKTDLNNLVNLTAFGGSFYQDLSGVVDHMPVRHLEILRIYSLGSAKSEGLEQLINLKSLHISEPIGNEVDLSNFAKLQNITELSINGSDDFSWISIVSNLKKLKVSNCSSVVDYSVLYGLPNIEVLELNNAKFLKAIDFVKNMPYLNSLVIHDAPIANINALENNKNLLQLNIRLSDYVACDFKALGTLTNLQELYFSPYVYAYSNVKELVDLSHMKNLSTISAGTHALSYLPHSIENMYFTANDFFDCNQFLEFPNLKLLKIESGHMTNSQALLDLKKLEVLSLDFVFFSFFETEPDSANTNLDFLKHSTLQELYLNRVKINNIFIESAIENGMSNSSLKILVVTDCDLEFTNEKESELYPLGYNSQFLNFS